MDVPLAEGTLEEWCLGPHNVSPRGLHEKLSRACPGCRCPEPHAAPRREDPAFLTSVRDDLTPALLSSPEV